MTVTGYSSQLSALSRMVSRVSYSSNRQVLDAGARNVTVPGSINHLSTLSNLDKTETKFEGENRSADTAIKTAVEGLKKISEQLQVLSDNSYALATDSSLSGGEALGLQINSRAAVAEINRLSSETEHMGHSLLNGETQEKSFRIGDDRDGQDDDSSDVLNLSIGSFSGDSLGLSQLDYSVSSSESDREKIDLAAQKVNAELSRLFDQWQTIKPERQEKIKDDVFKSEVNSLSSDVNFLSGRSTDRFTVAKRGFGLNYIGNGASLAKATISIRV